jgi:hypothetical protein
MSYRSAADFPRPFTAKRRVPSAALAVLFERVRLFPQSIRLLSMLPGALQHLLDARFPFFALIA